MITEKINEMVFEEVNEVIGDKLEELENTRRKAKQLQLTINTMENERRSLKEKLGLFKRIDEFVDRFSSLITEKTSSLLWKACLLREQE